MDPLTLARLWIAIRPFKRLRERREAKRAAALSAADDHGTVPSPEDTAPATVGAAPISQSEDAPMMQEVLTLLIRHGLTFAGGAGLLADNEYTQLAGAAATIVGLAWSAYRKWARARVA